MTVHLKMLSSFLFYFLILLLLQNISCCRFYSVAGALTFTTAFPVKQVCVHAACAFTRHNNPQCWHEEHVLLISLCVRSGLHPC